MMDTKAKQHFSSLICGACILVSPSLAQAQEGTPAPGGTRARIDIASGVEVSSNPFLTEGGSEAAAAYIAIDPSVFLEDGRHETTLRGSFRLSQYTNGYGQDESATVRINSNRALSERTSLNLSASAQSARANLRNLFTDTVDSSLADGSEVFPEPAEFDPTIVGTRVRTTSIATSATIEHVLSPIHAVEAKVSFQNYHYGNNAGIDYTDASLLLGYSRRLGPRTAFRVKGQVSLTNYDEDATGDDLVFGDAKTYLLSTIIEHDLDSQWEAKAGIGINLVDRDIGLAGRENNVLFVGEAALCRSGLQTRFCVTASRRTQPTAQAGITNVTSIGLSYEYRLSEDDTLAVSSYFGQTEQDQATLLANAVSNRNLMGVSARLRHELSDRASLVIQTSYSDVENPQQNVAADFSVSLGISLRLGSRY